MTLGMGGVLTRNVMKSADPAYVAVQSVQCSYTIVSIVPHTVLLPPTSIAGLLPEAFKPEFIEDKTVFSPL